ncbi:sulfotransferase family cytosolic 2B member 1-like isoform X1 [Denticeps clupeoides]|uniref:Sulfotransferase n=1 Tax=Denticeps clupeoides TaxID=299321 RepID=A0AAY4AWW0_9TELE|nr:sulfotransferase family cytosolic 2B member 1-like isoform X1 [Denticeps clupeoides]XP_028836409.1 sulfotransferase family cytosolic 2B member 1-like isoform X1 [Denticeps clupeoides]
MDGKYLTYHGLLCPKETHCADSLKYFEEFQCRDDDVFIITYPKSGTTWMQEIVPSLLSGGDLTAVTTLPNWDRVPWLEEKRAALYLKQRPSPRIIVSHMPFHLMPPSFLSSKVKAIYVTRDPRDVLVSSFYFHQMASFLDDPGTFDEFIEKFLNGEVLFGKWTDHMKSWQKADIGNKIMYVTYEAMIKDLKGVIGSLSRFLDQDLSDEVLEAVAKHCSFNSMKTNTMSNYSLVPQQFMDTSKSSFLRKGIAGDWKNHFSPEQEAKFRAVIEEEMEGSDVKLCWSEE